MDHHGINQAGGQCTSALLHDFSSYPTLKIKISYVASKSCAKYISGKAAWTSFQDMYVQLKLCYIFVQFRMVYYLIEIFKIQNSIN